MSQLSCANFCCPSKSETPNGACCYTNYAWWITFPILFVCCALAAFTVVLYAIIKRSRMRRMQRQQRMRQQQRQQQSINNNGFNGQPISFKPDHPRISSSSPQNQIMSNRDHFKLQFQNNYYIIKAFFFIQFNVYRFKSIDLLISIVKLSNANRSISNNTALFATKLLLH